MKIFLKAILILIIISGIGAAALLYSYQEMLEPVNPENRGDEILVEIPSGSGAAAIASILADKGLIKNELAFRLYVRQQNLGQGFLAGSYMLNQAMSVQDIIETIQSGDTYEETVWFTIPEGYNIKDIAERLAEAGLADQDVILKLAADPSESMLDKFPFLKEARSAGVEFLLEGYLFPDTYETYRNASEEEILLLMIGRMDSILTDDVLERIFAMDMSVHQILTMASLVEREGRVDHERPLIAGVFYNRLEIGQRLESCATIQYILGETKEFLSNEDLLLPSPYNTYQNNGLPPGPIASPGEASINAALYPEESDYYFFNYRYDESGEHFFSRNLQEHNANVAKAEANLQ